MAKTDAATMGVKTAGTYPLKETDERAHYRKVAKRLLERRFTKPGDSAPATPLGEDGGGDLNTRLATQLVSNLSDVAAHGRMIRDQKKKGRAKLAADESIKVGEK